MSEQLVANEFLAFLQQKLDFMDEVSAIQICVSSFSVDEICKSKEVLYKLLNKSGTFVPHRRGDEQGKKSLQDIIKILKEEDPDDVPTFVARELNKLPPVTFDHVDVTSLLKDIIILKKSLADAMHKIESSQETIADLRTEVNDLRVQISASRSSAVVTRVTEPPPSAILSPSAKSFKPRADPPAPRAAPAHTAPPARTAPPSAPPAKGRPPQPSLVKPSQPRDFASVVTGESPRAHSRVDEQGFTLVEKKKKRKAPKQPRKTQCGAAEQSSSLLVAATPNTALYISRLHHTTTPDSVAEYVCQKTEYKMKVFPLESRHYVHFKSFVVRVPTPCLSTVACPDFWPKDVVFRRFRGPLRIPEIPRQTSQVPLTAPHRNK